MMNSFETFVKLRGLTQADNDGPATGNPCLST